MKTKMLPVIILVILVAATAAFATPLQQIPYVKKTTLVFPKDYTLRFSLCDDPVGGSCAYWSEEKIVSMTNAKIITNLGDTVSLAGIDFSQQYYVQVEKKKANGTYKVIGARDMLGVVPYAMWCADSAPAVVAKSGQVLTGQLATRYPANTAFTLAAASYPVPLPPGTEPPTLEYLAGITTSATCPGIGQSTAGRLCVYGYNTSNIGVVTHSGQSAGLNRLYGFSLDVFPTNPAVAGYLLASWAYMVP